MNKVSERFREVRKQLGITQQQLAERLLLTRNYVAKIESGAQEPAARVVRDLESLRVDYENTQSTSGVLNEHASHYVHSRSRGPRGQPETPIGNSPMVDPRHAPRPAPPTKEECMAYLAEFLSRAEHEPGGLGYAWRQLQKYLPLDEFEPRESKK